MAEEWPDQPADLKAHQAQERNDGEDEDIKPDVDRDVDINATRDGAALDVIREGDSVYVVNQLVPPLAPPPPGSGDVSISFSFGPLTITGSVNPSKLTISVNISILGINLGGFHGDLRKGVSIRVNLIAVKGEVRFYLKNGNQVWVGFDLKVLFDGTFEKDVKLVTI